MPIASIQILKGRSSEDRKLLISRLTDVLVVTLGVEPRQVRVIITEVDPENWGVAGVTKADLSSGSSAVVFNHHPKQ